MTDALSEDLFDNLFDMLINEEATPALQLGRHKLHFHNDISQSESEKVSESRPKGQRGVLNKKSM